MAMICSICEDYLTEGQSQCSGDANKDPMALPCGHVFHHVCIQTWFNGIGGQNARNYPPNSGCCPKCKNICSLQAAVRIFPDTETTSAVEACKKTKLLEAENEKLSKELTSRKRHYQEVADVNETLQNQYQLVAAETDTLKQKYQKLTADHVELQLELAITAQEHAETVDTLREELEENRNLIRAMEVEAANRNNSQDVQVIAEMPGSSRSFADGSGPNYRRTNFRFTAKDLKILRDFIQKNGPGFFSMGPKYIRNLFMKSDDYKTMIESRGLGPCKKAVEKKCAEICEAIERKQRDTNNEFALLESDSDSD